jgi:hypothetical protein
LCIPEYQKGGSTLSICAFMVRDIKKRIKGRILKKKVFPSEIEVNLFIFKHIMITIKFIQTIKVVNGTT